MVFDPSTIRRKPLLTETEGGSRDERVASLAATLYERGLASSLGNAKRLAESMLETETKIISQSPGNRSVHTGEREKFAQDPLFAAVGGKAERVLGLPESFSRFIEQSKSMRGAPGIALAPSPAKPREEPKPAIKPVGHVMYEEAPATPREVKQSEVKLRPVERQEVEKAASQWTIPEKKSDAGYAKTMIESSPEGFVVRHVKATPTSDEVVEEGVIMDVPVQPKPVPPPEKKGGEDLAKKHGVDLFDIFRVNK